MKVVINNTAYTELKNISFASEVDVVGGELPINEFSAEIKTDDTIAIGQYAYLYDESDNLWAKYWIVSADRYSDYGVTIVCQSDILILDRAPLEPAFFNARNAANIITELFTGYSLNVSIDSSLLTATITGYCPEQTARQRLQWICFVIGAYVKQDFADIIQILPISDSITPIFNDKIFYRPSIKYNDDVTAVSITSYAYTEGYPTTTDEWVKVDYYYYVQTSRQLVVPNPNVSPLAPANVVEINDITLVNENNEADILNRIASYYFNRTEATVEVINNGEYSAGSKYAFDLGTGDIITGYARSCDFSFGKNHKAKIDVRQAVISAGVELDIVAKHNNTEIGRKVYYLPQGYSYSIDNPFYKKIGYENSGTERVYATTIYRPQNTAASGTVGQDVTVNEQEYSIAVRKEDRILKIYSVDIVDYDDAGVMTIT